METLLKIALIVWGVIIIIGNIPSLIYAIANLKAKGAIFDLIASVIGILLGLGLIFSQNKVITIILAAYMIIFPVIRIVLAKSAWAEQLKRVNEPYQNQGERTPLSPPIINNSL